MAARDLHGPGAPWGPNAPGDRENRDFRDLRRAVLTAPHPERRPGGLGVLEV